MFMQVGDRSFSSSFSFFAFESASSGSLVSTTFSTILDFYFKGLNLLRDLVRALGVFYRGDKFFSSLSPNEMTDPWLAIMPIELRFLNFNSAIT